MARGRQHAGASRATGLISVAIAAAAALAWVSAGSGAGGDVGWGGFGNTPNGNRHSPLTLINRGNVAQLGRVFKVDFRAIDAGTRRGQQSFPVIPATSCT